LSVGGSTDPIRGGAAAGPLASYFAAAAPPLSDNYFAQLFTPADQRERVIAVLACAAEIDGCSQRPGEAAVAALKLGWWREEIEQLAAGEPRHPVTTVLAQTTALRKPRELWFALIEASLRRLDPEPHASMDALLAHCTEAGATYELLALAFDADASARTRARALGAAAVLARIICQARRHTETGRVDLPLDALAAAGVPHETLHESWPPAAIELLAQLGAQARRTLDDQLAAVGRGERASLHAALILAELRRARLEALATRGYPADLDGPNALTRLLIAWRSARRSARAHTR
jgi:phytoene synthase